MLHDHAPSVRKRQLTSWVVEPSIDDARFSSTPSARSLTLPPLRSPSTVLVGRAAGGNAAVPDGLARMSAGERWPVGKKLQPSRPRPTSTQPPPCVVMSQ